VVTMASDNRVRVLRAAGAASAAAPYVRRTAPYVRRIMSDDELREDLRRIVQSARHLYEELSDEGVSKLFDEDVRKDIDKIMEAVQEAGERIVTPPRRGHTGAWVVGGTLIGVAVAGVLIYPPTRKAIMRAVGMDDGSAWIDTGMGGDSGSSEAEPGGQMAA